MAFVRLTFCVAGVYSMFLIWAISQERLSVPFTSGDGQTSDKFKSALFLGTCQSALCCLSSLTYILFCRKPGETLSQTLGLQRNLKAAQNGNGSSRGVKPNGNTVQNGHFHQSAFSTKALLLRYLQCALFITCAAPFGFAALSYISYPAMVLGKSCKLVPVLIMNVILYRRKFAPHKYVVVTMVTAGITLFMHYGNEKKSTKASAPSSSTYTEFLGMLYLLINLALDGAVNSTQDEIFARYKVSGQQMMFWINLFSTTITIILSALPLPHIPVVHPSNDGKSELLGAIAFIQSHPSIIYPLIQFSVTGSLGQLFIFETLQHFGSLTLVTITLTRKLFTMLLSVVVYNHTLTAGQWLGAAVVFAGISVEAWVKRKDVHAKRVIAEKEKARIKSL